ncbi:hypothetical protein H0H93_016509, partial [Arthromyces matolae]
MRTTLTVYRHLGAFLDEVDAAHGGEDPTIDADFRSGVYLGVGMCNIILSLIPGKLQTLVELLGYHGDRKKGLEILMRVGGWSSTTLDGEKKVAQEPSVPISEEGIRRPIVDLALLLFHLVLSTYTSEGVDIPLAARIVEFNLHRYPDGPLPLLAAGRLHLKQARPHLAISYYKKAMRGAVEGGFRNLRWVAGWECAVARMAGWEVGISGSDSDDKTKTEKDGETGREEKTQEEKDTESATA